MTIPNDSYILLSYINMKLRDFYTDLDDLVKSLDVDKEDICTKLKQIGYNYNAEQNQFIPIETA